MNTGSGMLLIILGLVMMYALITGKFGIIEHAFYQMFGLEEPPDSKKENAAFKKGQDAGAAIQKEIDRVTLPDIFIPNYTKK